jgi:signal transduction histidine kinase
MSTMQRIGLSQRRIWMALFLALAALFGAHAGLEYALVEDLDPLIFVVDGVTAVLLLLVAGLYLRSIARERRRRVVEQLLLELLAAPRNINDTASEALRLLTRQGIGEAATLAIAGEGEAPLKPIAAHGYPRGWIEGAAPMSPPAENDGPRLIRPKAPHPWLQPVAARVSSRPWIAEIPLRSGTECIGLLVIGSRRQGTLGDVAILELLGTHLGAAIDHAALYEAAYARERDLEDQDARRREFMSAIAHEIRTPLTAIQAFADLLQVGQAQMDPLATHLVTSLGHGVGRLSSLVNDLIDLGRAGSTGYALQPQDVDVAAVVRGAEETLRPALMLQNQSITLDLPPSGPIACVDVRVLEQVTLNLLSNANRHSPAGGSITISARQVDAAVRLEVADTGPGIPLAERERIFQPYYRIRREDGAEVPGSGLGLAVARRILEESGGRIWVEDRQGSGACFCVEVRAAARDSS